MRRTNQERRRFRPELGGAALEDRSLLSTFTVTNLADSGTGSLRTAVALSNLTPGTDTIRFAPGLTGQIALTSGQLDLTDNVSILGPGANRISVSGTGSSRIFETHHVTATISGLTLQDGVAETEDMGVDPGDPGVGDGLPGGGGDGGAIQEDGGALTLSNDVFANNAAAERGGAIFNFYGVLNSRNDQYVGNQVGHHGGAIFNSGVLTSTGDRFVGNTSDWGGGAIETGRSLFALPGVTASLAFDQFVGNSSGLGGAVANEFSGSMTVVGTTFTANHASRSGGAVFNTAPAVVSNSTFTGNSAQVNGGAIQSIANLALSFSTLEFNSASNGGAVWALNGTFTPVADTIQFNSQPQVFLA